MRYRIGHGIDVHRWAEGRRLVLGGVEIPWTKGLVGHSDADVATHALCNALLGAVGAGDLDAHFPDTDESLKDISSLELLKKAVALIAQRGCRVVNVDVTIIAEEPHLAPYRESMRNQLAAVLQTSKEGVNVKAVTCEGMGFVGRGEGMAAAAVVLLEKVS